MSGEPVVRSRRVTVVCLDGGVVDASDSRVPAGDEPTGRTTPYEASCGGGRSGSGAERECDVGNETGLVGSSETEIDASRTCGVAAVQDWHPHAVSGAASIAATLTAAASAVDAATVDAPGIEVCIPLISPRVAHAMPPPSTENNDPYAAQPRHHTVMNAVQRAVRRAKGERKRRISNKHSRGGVRTRKNALMRSAADRSDRAGQRRQCC